MNSRLGPNSLRGPRATGIELSNAVKNRFGEHSIPDARNLIRYEDPTGLLAD